MTDWLPIKDISEIPEQYKDGRYILVWATTMDVNGDEYQHPWVTTWMSCGEWYRAFSWYDPTHYALIEPPTN